MLASYFCCLVYLSLLGVSRSEPQLFSAAVSHTRLIRGASSIGHTWVIPSGNTIPYNTGTGTSAVTSSGGHTISALGTSTASQLESPKTSKKTNFGTSTNLQHWSVSDGTAQNTGVSSTTNPEIPITVHNSGHSISSTTVPVVVSLTSTMDERSSGVSLTLENSNPSSGGDSSGGPSTTTAPIPTSVITGSPKTTGTVAIQALVPDLKSATVLIDKIVTYAHTLAASGTPAQTDAATLGGMVSSLFNSLFTSAASGTGSSLASALQSIELDTLNIDPELQKQVQQVVSSLTKTKDTLNQALAVLKQKISVTNAKKLLEVILLGTVEYEGIKKLALWSFDDEKPTSAAVSKPSPTSTSTTSSTTPSETPIRYLIGTKRGTTLETFQAFIKTLPDKGQGDQMVYPNLDDQSYATNILPSQVEAIRAHPIVEGVCRDAIPDGEEIMMRAVDSQKRKRAPTWGKRNLDKAVSSPEHLRIISQHPFNAMLRRDAMASGKKKFPDMPDYILDPIAGEGTSIFVIDTGINPQSVEFDNSVAKPPLPGWYIVPSKLTGPFPPRPQDIIPGLMRPFVPPDADNLMVDRFNHGTCVASIVAGSRSGVAKKAHLVPVKYKNNAGQAQTAAVEDAWRWVISTVIARNTGPNPPRPGWAVINFSTGYRLRADPKPEDQADFDRRTAILTKALQRCRENDITVVIAAGNGGQEDSVSKTVPQNLAGDAGESKGIVAITVGAVDAEGRLWEGTTGHASGEPGGIDVYAMGKNVDCASNVGTDSMTKLNGTSLAAPAVAGLAAYYLSLTFSDDSSAPNLHQPGTVAKAVKDYIKQTSYTRQRPIGENPGLNVAYNNAENGLCEAIGAGSSRPSKKRHVLENMKLYSTLEIRATDYSLVPVIVDGNVVDSSYTFPCSKPATISTTASTTIAPTTSSSTTSSPTIHSSTNVSSLTSSPEPTSQTSTVAESTTPPPASTHGPDPQCQDTPLVQC